VIQKDKNNKLGKEKFSLRDDVAIDIDPKDPLTIVLIQKAKKKEKLIIHLLNENEKTQWFVALSDAISKAEAETYSMKSDHNPLMQVFKDNLYDAVRGRVCSDDVNLNNHVKALNGIIELFKDSVKKIKEEFKKNHPTLVPKISNLENLGLSMEKVINNILEEIELSHE